MIISVKLAWLSYVYETLAAASFVWTIRPMSAHRRHRFSRFEAERKLVAPTLFRLTRPLAGPTGAAERFVVAIRDELVRGGIETVIICRTRATLRDGPSEHRSGAEQEDSKHGGASDGEHSDVVGNVKNHPGRDTG